MTRPTLIDEFAESYRCSEVAAVLRQWHGGLAYECGASWSAKVPMPVIDAARKFLHRQGIYTHFTIIGKMQCVTWLMLPVTKAAKKKVVAK